MPKIRENDTSSLIAVHKNTEILRKKKEFLGEIRKMMPSYGKLGTNWNNKNGRIAVIQEMNKSKNPTLWQEKHFAGKNCYSSRKIQFGETIKKFNLRFFIRASNNFYYFPSKKI